MYQLLEQYSENDKGIPRSYRATLKAHATLFLKKILPLYLEHLRFLVFGVGWVVTKIYSHFSYEQERFKRNFILMNQRSWQTAKNLVEKDFFKLLNNTNFGYDCRNNLGNFKSVPIFDELNEISYVKKYYNVFDVSKFVYGELLKREITENFNNEMMKIQKMIHSTTLS